MKKVCVLGSGASGIAAVKSCLEERMHVVCFEKRDGIGGTWNRSYKKNYQGARIYDSLVTNFCKETSCYSDFPFDESVPVYPRPCHNMEYFHSYADHYNLWPHIVFNREIISLEEFKTGWRVISRDLQTNETMEDVFDFVIVCCGSFACPFIPPLPGLEQFKNVRHSCTFKSAENLRDKNVLVVGFGNSGSDIVVEASKVARNTFVSFRTGNHVVTRLHKNGIPQDLNIMTRFQHCLYKWIPNSIMNWFLERNWKTIIKHQFHQMKAKHSIYDVRSCITINDEAMVRISAGCIKLKPEVRELSSNKVWFVDGTSEEIDEVIFSTGYKKEFPFLDKNIITDDLGKSEIYKWIFPINVQHPGSLAVIGLISNTGLGSCPALELQSRYAAAVMSGNLRLPPKKCLKNVVAKQMNEHWKHGYFNLRTPFFTYIEDIASDMGVKPTLWKLFRINPRLIWFVYFKPFLPYHYRIVGRHSCSRITANFLANSLSRLFSAFK